MGCEGALRRGRARPRPPWRGRLSCGAAGRPGDHAWRAHHLTAPSLLPASRLKLVRHTGVHPSHTCCHRPSPAGNANRLLATRLDAILTSELTSGRDAARAKRKVLIGQSEALIDRCELLPKQSCIYYHACTMHVPCPCPCMCMCMCMHVPCIYHAGASCWSSGTMWRKMPRASQRRGRSRTPRPVSSEVSDELAANPGGSRRVLGARARHYGLIVHSFN